MTKKKDDLNSKISRLALLTGETLGLLARGEIEDYLNEKGFSNDDQNNVRIALIKLGNFFLINNK